MSRAARTPIFFDRVVDFVKDKMELWTDLLGTVMAHGRPNRCAATCVGE